MLSLRQGKVGLPISCGKLLAVGIVYAIQVKMFRYCAYTQLQELERVEEKEGDLLMAWNVKRDGG